ncbi:unnamed protein product [Vitrella brassicaformis CCMP3155]|uniref:Potassium channel tetramerisation-type BTB domain-containing protein n=1 Tax=Vitrella brassicaformis (strain CCMP3155) TaxID=1169540 RepID=A0A0G4EKI3_VITBC|nr:unnamed protein product [Vitrella brassicaformis CCMP3155]|eukprot:CEL97955.1 unnamed protein product [Vitrella brassicaformis CCMP3155]
MAAAAAAGSAAEKRKRPSPGGGAEDECGNLDESIAHCQQLLDALQEIKNDLMQQERAIGGTADTSEPSAECMREILAFNVGGDTTVKARRSTLCAVKGTVMALLFSGRFDAGFRRDSNNRIFLQLFPDAFTWLVGQLLTYVGEQTIDSIVIPDSRRNDTPFKYWVELLMSDPGYKRRASRVQIPPLTQDQQEEQQQGAGGEQQQQQQQRDAEDLSVELTSMIRRAKADRDAQMERLQAIRPLLKTGNVEDDALVSIEVSGAVVTVTKGVATSLGDDSTFANIFLKYDRSSHEVDPAYVRRIVDAVARAHMMGVAVKALDVQGAVGELAIKGYRHALTMYGLDSDRYLGPVDGLLKLEHLQKMRQWCEDEEEDPPAIPSHLGEPLIRIYKATVDGWKWLDFLEAVKGHSPLLLISKVDATTELFAIIIDGPIEVAGAAETEHDTRAHAFKLQGTDSHPYVGYMGWRSNMYIAGTQERVTQTIDLSSPASDAPAVLVTACFDFGIRPAAQQIGAPAAASDETMKRCQGYILEHDQPDVWLQWQRPSVRPGHHGWDDDSVYQWCSVKGFHFNLSDLEAYKLG